MKKIFLIALLSSIALNAYADNLICPFTDYFEISTPPGYTITSISSADNVVVEQQGPLNFVTHCKDSGSTKSGKVYVTIASNDCDLCTLHITDGPYEMNPTVNFSSCVGRLTFNGTDHVWGTYTYTLRFSH